MLVEKLSFYDFLEEFKKYGREDSFSYAGKKALFEYLNELEEPIELNIISICRDFREFQSLEEFHNDYGCYVDCIDDISYYTNVIDIDGTSFIIQDF